MIQSDKADKDKRKITNDQELVQSETKSNPKLEFVFYVKTDVSPFLRACPKYASKSYTGSSCESHILSFCFISVPSFIEIFLTVFKL